MFFDPQNFIKFQLENKKKNAKYFFFLFQKQKIFQSTWFSSYTRQRCQVLLSLRKYNKEPVHDIEVNSKWNWKVSSSRWLSKGIYQALWNKGRATNLALDLVLVYTCGTKQAF